MKRKTFIQLSTTLMATPLLSSLEGWAQAPRLKNWAGNLTFSTDHVFYPKSVQEVQQLVKTHAKLKVLGTRHCFNTIADSKDNLLSTKELNKVLSLDKKGHTVTVEGGIKYGELAPYLHKVGFALNNLASLPHISVAGSITTATHGSGVKNGNLSSAVTALEIVTADGNIVHLSKATDAEKLNAAVVGLGALGVITKVTLQVEPTYMMQQRVFTRMPMAQVKQNFEKIVSAGYSVSLFTDWQQDSINEVWIKSRIGTDKDHNGPEFYGAKAATKNVHPIIALSAENCTEQMGVPGPWYERLPHFKMGFTPSSGKELQSEYFVPIHHAVEAISAIARLGKQIGPHLFITEIRTIAADKLWMSPCHNQTSVTIHFTWKQETAAVLKLLPLIEKELSPFNARPHWGKIFTMAPKVLESRYEKLNDFKKLVAEYDPKGKFRNDFLSKEIYG
ncbi:xylitol oxidase [Mucilaginibacter lappiensis]|uniref:Xylitol oxidase n=1 Tax=Mucilaginibacter lappiensis TaxID=354630 RepID=A0ABR6PUH0_9SPHI|nr:FAD-binding protein [Mucilaginibacter lappiensis]MBB6111946.1 xylitol oxidase [Mucilaginibacter lappiensis]SIR90800.1 xylitol oxidase [Mucilaginibacter lappiensis]